MQPIDDTARRRILNAVDAAFDAQVDFLASLVRCASQRGEETGVQDLVEAALRERGYAVDRFLIDPDMVGKHPAFSPVTVPYDKMANVVGVRKAIAPKGHSLALNAHVDVVPTGNPARWEFPPYDAVRRGDWLYGRGAGDMKAGLTAALFALDAIKAAGFELTADVQLQSVVEEEITGNGAAMALVKGFVADAILIPEPTDEKLVRANSGVNKFAITVEGVPAHPREIDQGISAIDAAVRLIEHLRKLEAKWNEEAQSKPFFEDVDNPAALTIGTIAGGEWIASVPSSCRFEGRIGFYPGDDPQQRAREFEAFVAEAVAGDPGFRNCPPPRVEWVGVMHAGYALEPGSNAEATLALAHQAARDGSGPLEAYVMACYLDAAVFAVHGNIPSLVYGPVVENIHAVDERVSLSSLRRVTRTIALFAAGWCGIRS